MQQQRQTKGTCLQDRVTPQTVNIAPFTITADILSQSRDILYGPETIPLSMGMTENMNMTDSSIYSNMP